MPDSRPVLILGAGINGTAIARELLLRRIPVVLIDTNDIAYGATSRSSRLIHGGLRYLEYGEFDLVRESLGERKHLLASAPHLVRPLRLHTPTPARLGGFFQSVRRFFGWPVGQPAPRGMWLVRLGLWVYQFYAADPDTRRVATNRPGRGEAPLVDPARFQWVSSYDDGQVLWPERLAMEWLVDAQELARQGEIDFQVFTRTRATRIDDQIALRPVAGAEDEYAIDGAANYSFQPRLVINATGSWVDDALEKLNTPSKRLMGGTKGSHLFVANDRLREILGDDGIYAEASDCRPVFILPMHDVALVGTTDLPFDDDPDVAVAESDEVNYLIDAVNRVFPDAAVAPRDVVAHYAGVRPLPFVDASTPGAITRRHFLHHHEDTTPPILSIIGGKLTTCRALAEEAAEWVLEHCGAGGERGLSSSTRSTPGGCDYPASNQIEARIESVARAHGVSVATAQAVWRLFGVRSDGVLTTLAAYGTEALEPLDAALPLPVGLARYVVEHEWARSLEDIVERRLFLVHARTLKREWIERLARHAGATSELTIQQQVDRCAAHLKMFYGRVMETNA